MSDVSLPGFLLIGHGTREPEGIAAFHSVVEQVAMRLPEVAVESCFLERSQPTIAEGVRRLTRRAGRRMIAMPLLLFAAGHVRRDIPRALAAAAEQTGVAIEQISHLGCHAGMVELSAQRYAEALTVRKPVAAEETALVLVGRGSRDPRATAEMRQFAELRVLQTPVARLELAFLAMEQPRLPAVLAQVAASGARRIVVQPHLLFAGCLWEQLQAEVRQAAQECPDHEWLVAEPLGPDPRLAQTVGELFGEAVAGRELGAVAGRKMG